MGKRDGKQKTCSRDCAIRYGAQQTSKRNDTRLFFGIPRREIHTLIERHYPELGADGLSALTGIPSAWLLARAGKLGVVLNPDVYYKHVHEQAREYMTKHNPMKLDEVKSKVAQWRIDHPEEVELTRIALTVGQSKLQKTKPSKLELRLCGYLDELGVKYEHAAVIKKHFVVDIRIDRLIIEADGDYWHGHPRFEPLTERQIKQQKRDAARNKYLRKCGYTVVRIWESDMSLDTVREVIRSYHS